MLVLPNVWDVASARAVAESGFPVLATSSSAVAASLGYEDGDSMPVDEVFGMIARISRAVDLPVTADVEAGYRLSPDELVGRLLAAGAVGCNIEDTDHHADGAPLVPAAHQAERIAAIRAAAARAGVDVVVNARVDLFRRPSGDLAELTERAVERARAYREAGADCVYPIRLSDPELIATFVASVSAPVNILVQDDGPPLGELARLGIARASLAGGLFRAALAGVRARLQEVAAAAR
jgi:2-methylisocitrate lyase-like PEP mutase family enzyme